MKWFMMVILVFSIVPMRANCGGGGGGSSSGANEKAVSEHSLLR